MVIYGWRETLLKSSQPQHLECQNCKTKGTISLNIFSNYVHVFWIPIFPVRRRGVSICLNCEEQLKPKKMPIDVRTEYDALKGGARPPIWQFIGLFLILVFAAYSFYQINRTEKQELEYLQAPLENDMYRYETEDDNYSTFLVYKALDDSVYLIPNCKLPYFPCHSKLDFYK